MNNKKILSKGWKLLALNEICDLQNGYAFKSNDYINISNTLNCRMSNIRPDGFFDIEHNQKFLPDSYIEKYKQYLLKDGDVIIAMTDMATEAKILGVPTIVKTQGKNLLLNQRVGKLIIKKPELINFPYLKYVLNREQVKKYFLKFAGGGLQINLGKEDILSVEIPLPPIAEQKRIAEILDRTQSLISKRKKAIAKLDNLIQSIFIEMFGDPITNPKRWNSRTLEEIAIKLTDGEHLNPDFSLDGMPIVMAGNVLEDFVDIQNAKKVDVTLGEKFRRKCSPERGDILLVSRGATIGRLCTVDFSDDFCLMGSVILIKLNHFSVESKYLKSLLKQPLMYAKLFNTSGSSAQQAIYLKDLKRLICLLPPLPLQKEFAQRVEAVEKLKATHRASLSQLEALFASLQHRAFRGEL